MSRIFIKRPRINRKASPIEEEVRKYGWYLCGPFFEKGWCAFVDFYDHSCKEFRGYESKLKLYMAIRRWLKADGPCDCEEKKEENQ